MFAVRVLLSLLVGSMLAVAADRIATPYESIRGVLQQLGPAELKSANARTFAAWAREKDAAIRARLGQGDLDSAVNLLLFGTSFTTQPRMTMENFAAETRAGVLRTRVDDLLKAVANPGGNERLAFLKTLLAGKNAGPFLLENVQRVLKERIEINSRIAQQDSADNAFSSRGVSLDTTILPNYAIDAALREIQGRGLVRSVGRAAIVGPGLDFIDKDSGFDFYPLQTLQPFAVHDSLRRLGLGDARITILDISPRVIAHIAGLRTRMSYTIQLPRDTGRQWTAAAMEYWRRFGPEAVDAIPAPLKGVETRAARFPVPMIDAADVNIVGQQLRLKAEEKFDLIVATNILVYYDPFEQALALANIAAMLKPGGFLLSNDPLPVAPSVPMKLAGQTAVTYSESPVTGDTVYWYQRDRCQTPQFPNCP